MVRILTAVLSDGMTEVQAACTEALEGQAVSADVVLNALYRQSQPEPPAPIMTPERLQLTAPPLADCARYDGLRHTAHVKGDHVAHLEVA